MADVDASVNSAAVLGDVGLYAVHVEADVDMGGHGLLVRVLHYKVLVEEAEGLLVRCRR